MLLLLYTDCRMMNKKEKSNVEKILDPEEYFEKSGVNNSIRDVSNLSVCSI